MKSTVSKQTEAYLNDLEEAEKKGEGAIPYHANPDAIDQIIIENKLEIIGLSFYPEVDLMLIVLNNKRVLKSAISEYERLASASLVDLEKYEISPMGVHWPALDEDLSLRGFLKHELAFSDSPQIG